ncbi:QacE family quaternary ammonium compound efflux SMR transporter [Thioalkalivibrio denitrificans]|uniref:Guanidinium exporter n=1 Tax=Thioalkalivibrio denitrificans TaxID=108003 RepID=A0A1V3ND05_9GAMM|nr:quaternary ammonium compound efflux SMR transporter SugE [Thioalkalivibrio denitrificans]OOG22666.1 QacE family quaternary ammonium compound efflux SMR transporter [Thioalkalivibrio denitrificans]
MSWLILLLAGLLEIVWAIGLKSTNGFTRLAPSLVNLVATAGSFYLLSVAMRSLPLSTAYVVWVGIGAVDAAIAGLVILPESVTTLKITSLLLIIVGIIGLQLTSPA